ncbi:hypothetical protein NP233_g7200 [Leucocoprinus birnbaumii]|uniref:C2H2-type domain-containing protein n=1 Tax=Leucocoprinus birnbaumii TaxID=56174 RepID=A0AAD5VPQ0_9AGAR|nr:hypothetical protein NP233_g7200 [Leucocoprinus birnbaumii]
MFPYEYTDPFQLHMSSDFDYDFDAHIAQCANVFGPDEKGLLDNHRPIPFLPLPTDGFGSSDSSSPSPSRSPSVPKDIIKREPSDSEAIMPGPSSPPPLPLARTRERKRSFDGLRPARCPSPSLLSRTHRSILPETTPSTSNLKLSEPEIPGSRKRTRISVTSRAHDYDEDADDESDNDTDDDYVPSPRSSVPKRRRTSSQISCLRSAPPIRTTSASPIPTKRPPGSSLSRNKQATSAAAIDRACNGNLTFVCPECGWKQANKRLPDFKRHLRTHTRPDEADQTKGWRCKGVLVEDAHRFNIPKDAEPFVFLGQKRIGGCLQTFSRRDALKRHLDNVNVVCVGRPCEASDD